MTVYLVLKKNGKGWDEFLSQVEATNSKSAIQSALLTRSALGDPSGEYVAVPARSWDPVKVETKQAFSFS